MEYPIYTNDIKLPLSAYTGFMQKLREREQSMWEKNSFEKVIIANSDGSKTEMTFKQNWMQNLGSGAVIKIHSNYAGYRAPTDFLVALKDQNDMRRDTPSGFNQYTTWLPTRYSNKELMPCLCFAFDNDKQCVVPGSTPKWLVCYPQDNKVTRACMRKEAAKDEKRAIRDNKEALLESMVINSPKLLALPYIKERRSKWQEGIRNNIRMSFFDMDLISLPEKARRANISIRDEEKFIDASVDWKQMIIEINESILKFAKKHGLEGDLK